MTVYFYHRHHLHHVQSNSWSRLPVTKDHKGLAIPQISRTLGNIGRLRCCRTSTVLFTLETDNPSFKSVKIDGQKKMNKVRRIVHLKLRPFHFQIKTYNMSDTNYPRDNQSQTDNPFLVWVQPFLQFKVMPFSLHVPWSYPSTNMLTWPIQIAPKLQSS